MECATPGPFPKGFNSRSTIRAVERDEEEAKQRDKQTHTLAGSAKSTSANHPLQAVCTTNSKETCGNYACLSPCLFPKERGEKKEKKLNILLNKRTVALDTEKQQHPPCGYIISLETRR